MIVKPSRHDKMAAVPNHHFTCVQRINNNRQMIMACHREAESCKFVGNQVQQELARPTSRSPKMYYCIKLGTEVPQLYHVEYVPRFRTTIA